MSNREELQIVECASGIYTLSSRIEKEEWAKVAHCFYYFNNADEEDEEDWRGNVNHYCGYAINQDKIDEVEKILNIKEELKYSIRKRLAEERKENKKKELEIAKQEAFEELKTIKERYQKEIF